MYDFILKFYNTKLYFVLLIAYEGNETYCLPCQFYYVSVFLKTQYKRRYSYTYEHSPL
jgi:hypothetical protein